MYVNLLLIKTLFEFSVLHYSLKLTINAFFLVICGFKSISAKILITNSLVMVSQHNSILRSHMSFFFTFTPFFVLSKTCLLTLIARSQVSKNVIHRYI